MIIEPVFCGVPPRPLLVKTGIKNLNTFPHCELVLLTWWQAHIQDNKNMNTEVVYPLFVTKEQVKLTFPFSSAFS